MSKVIAFWICVSICATAKAVSAQSLEAAGRVISVSGLGWVEIIRSDGVRERAQYPRLLFGGDRFEFHGAAVLTVNVQGAERTVTQDSPPFTVPGRQARESPLDFFADFLSRSRLPILTYNLGRTGQLPAPVTLSPDPLAPVGVQHLLRSTQQLALVWRGGPASLHFVGIERGVANSGALAWMVIPLAGERQPFKVQTEDSALFWSIDFVDQPPPMPAAAAAVSPDDPRLARAAWLLTSGPRDWRLFALSELASMADEGDFAADQLWRGVRSGELADYLSTRPQPLRELSPRR